MFELYTQHLPSLYSNKLYSKLYTVYKMTTLAIDKKLPSIKEYDSLSVNPFEIDTGNNKNKFSQYPTDPKFKKGSVVDGDGVVHHGLDVKPDSQWITKDQTEFVKFFSGSFAKFKDMSQPAKNILNFVVESIKHDNDFICLPIKIVLEYCGYHCDSRAIYYTGMKELLSKRILSPKTSVVKHEYWINPNIFFKGDRVPLYISQQKKW